MNKSEKALDLLVWGATGFTGKLIAEYLARSAPKGFKWAIGGRNKDRLAQIKDGLCKINQESEAVKIIIGDVNDQKSVDEAMKQTRVVINAAGPYYRYGTPVVDACVRFGTDYVDLTGEGHWIKQIIDKYDDKARENGVLIVPSCGFDSVPSDLGALMMAEHATEKYGVSAKYIKCLIQMGGGISGGTVHSGMEVIEHANPKDIRNPYLLNPAGKIPDRKAPYPTVKYDKDLKLYSYPFFLSFGNMLMARRTQGLQDFKHGKYVYDEAGGTKSGLVAFAATFLTVVVFLLLKLSIFRTLAKKLVPAGSGPSQKTMDEGFFRLNFVADLENNKKIFGRVSAVGDPGYSVTAKMIAESGLCLALQRDKIPAAKTGGILSPGYSMGNVLIQRLRNIGLEFSVDE